MSDLNLVLVVFSIVLWIFAFKFYSSFDNYNKHNRSLDLADLLFLFLIKPPSKS